MAQDFSKIMIGPAIVEYGEGANAVTFETTIGGIVLTTETSYRDQLTDQTGQTVVSRTITGRNVTVQVPFGEYDLATIAKIMVGASAVTDGTDTKVNIATGVGSNLLDAAKKLVIKPLAHKTDANHWVTLPLAFPQTDLNYQYNNDNELITNVTFQATPDENNIVLVLGDETVTATP